MGGGKGGDGDGKKKEGRKEGKQGEAGETSQVWSKGHVDTFSVSMKDRQVAGHDLPCACGCSRSTLIIINLRRSSSSLGMHNLSLLCWCSCRSLCFKVIHVVRKLRTPGEFYRKQDLKGSIIRRVSTY